MAAMETAHRFSLRHFPLLQSEKSLKPCIFTPDIPKLLDSHFRTCRSETSSESHLHGTENLQFSVAVARHSRVASGSRRKQEEDELARHSQSRRPGSARTRQGIEPGEIGSDKIQKIIDDMISSMRKAPVVGLAAPQIGIPLRIVVLEDTKEYISHAHKEEIKAQDIRPFDLLVIINPKLKKKSNRTALFFEGVDGFRAVVERYLDVEVDGLDRYGNPIKVNASGWQARLLQHECDHLEGTLYVDKMVPKTFRTVDNLDLPLADGCPKLGVRQLLVSSMDST